ncbi:LPS assembly lipoprotein LptE [uncultured Albimonas sp.]|uniref:LPS assembly lipoprotein LptE n=1 Tax=uncultured Albimonas sp. TaxID=1331701 RepID=UPI0030EB8505|tara:strand:- start:4460 stop:4966 length:507 start_codon:yes stop_codon:yes gene_type:complete
MWSPDRRALLRAGLTGGAALALSACGFRPALKAGTEQRALRNAVSLSVPEGRLGFALRETLESRLGRPGAAPAYLLTADLVMVDSGLAITQDSSITRYVITGTSRWALTGPEGFRPIEGVSEGMTAYSATASLFATRQARRDSEARVAKELGERIWTRLVAELEAREG